MHDRDAEINADMEHVNVAMRKERQTRGRDMKKTGDLVLLRSGAVFLGLFH